MDYLSELAPEEEFDDDDNYDEDDWEELEDFSFADKDDGWEDAEDDEGVKTNKKSK